MAPNATHTANSIRQSDCNVLKKEVKQLEIFSSRIMERELSWTETQIPTESDG
uniref:Uncharacterized protein n=1 Tax=Tetraselmis sp. GSL018 TaxID=582737 RepID=A0A061RY43_9CHLO